MECGAFLLAPKYLDLLPPTFHNFCNLLFSDVLTDLPFHHQVCFLHIPFFVQQQVFYFSVADLVSIWNNYNLPANLKSHKFHLQKIQKIDHEYQLVGDSIHAILIQIFYTNLHFCYSCITNR